MSDYMRVRLQYAGVGKPSSEEDNVVPICHCSAEVSLRQPPALTFHTGVRHFLRLQKTSNSFSYSHGCKLQEGT